VTVVGHCSLAATAASTAPTEWAATIDAMAGMVRELEAPTSEGRRLLRALGLAR
jgi:hypothetical protein